MATSFSYQVVPTTTSPSQSISIALGGQACQINFYTKSINLAQPSEPIYPPVYQNWNPCFVDLFVNDTAIVTGVLVRQGSLIVRDTYLGFVGDLAVIDTIGTGADPYGVQPTLPPPRLRNQWQRRVPLALGDRAPSNIAGTIPGMGTRFLLTYWAPGTYTPGYSP